MVYDLICKAKSKGRKLLAVLIDPDKEDFSTLNEKIDRINKLQVDLLFIGGSQVEQSKMQMCLEIVKSKGNIPSVLFPGDAGQVCEGADALLFMSLISGRNPEYLIGQQVKAAPSLKKSKMECISTGYMLIDGGKSTSATYVSNTLPIPTEKDDIACSTALAGEMIGMKLIYMDAGSGAKHTIKPKMISKVKSTVTIPLIIGGGIRTEESAISACKAGADVIVIGTLMETNPDELEDILISIKSYKDESCNHIKP